MLDISEKINEGLQDVDLQKYMSCFMGEKNQRGCQMAANEIKIKRREILEGNNTLIKSYTVGKNQGRLSKGYTVT